MKNNTWNNAKHHYYYFGIQREKRRRGLWFSQEKTTKHRKSHLNFSHTTTKIQWKLKGFNGTVNKHSKNQTTHTKKKKNPPTVRALIKAVRRLLKSPNTSSTVRESNCSPPPPASINQKSNLEGNSQEKESGVRLQSSKGGKEREEGILNCV